MNPAHRGEAGPPRLTPLRRAGATAAIVLGLFGCLTTEPCACPPIVPHVTLYGTATSAGTPMAGAGVVAKLFFGDTCPAADAAVTRLARTDTVGRYEGELPALQSSVCFGLGAVAAEVADTLWSEVFLLDLTRVAEQTRFRYDLSFP